MFAHDYLLWSVAAISIFCAGCATSKGPAFNYAPQAEDQAAKTFTVPEGKSVIYVFADPDNRLQTVIQVDQRDVCRLAVRTYYRAVLEPGQHQLGIRCEGKWGDGTPFRIAKERIINVEPTHAYFFTAVVNESVGPGGFLLTGVQSQVTVDLSKRPGWMGRSIIRDRRNRLTGELIGP